MLHSTVSNPQRQKLRETLEVLTSKAQTAKTGLARSNSIPSMRASPCVSLALAWRVGFSNVSCKPWKFYLCFSPLVADLSHELLRCHASRQAQHSPEAIVSDRMTSRADGFRLLCRLGRKRRLAQLQCLHLPLDAQKVLLR